MIIIKLVYSSISLEIEHKQNTCLKILKEPPLLNSKTEKCQVGNYKQD